MPRKKSITGARKPMSEATKARISAGVKATYAANPPKKKVPTFKIYQPEPDIVDTLDFLAERVDGLTKAVMSMEALGIHTNENLERLTDATNYLGVQVSDLTENLYSETQEMCFTEVLAALVISMRRQTLMWEKLTGIKQEDYDTAED